MLDAEVQAFIRETLSLYPEDAAALSISDQRALYNAMSAHFRAPRPDGLEVVDTTTPGRDGPVPVRRYRPETPAPVRVVYFHGGGFALGGLESHDDACGQLAKAASVEVIAVDYRLSPETPHPGAYHDALDAARAAAAEGPIVLCGDSVGGNLTGAVSLGLRDAADAPSDRVRGQVMIYPSLGGEALKLPAYRERRDAPLLSSADLLFYWRLRMGVSRDADLPWDDPIFAPLAAADFAGLPPCAAFGVSHDPLRDDPRAWCERLVAAGVSARWEVVDGLVHGCLRARTRSAKARAFFERIVEAVRSFATT